MRFLLATLLIISTAEFELMSTPVFGQDSGTVSAGFGSRSSVQEKNLSEVFAGLLRDQGGSRKRAFEFLERNWEAAFVPPLVEAIRVSRSIDLHRDIFSLIRSKTDQNFGFDLSRWFEWIWKEKIQPHAEYADIKSQLYRRLDPKFAGYFAKNRKADIRLDEISLGRSGPGRDSAAEESEDVVGVKRLTTLPIRTSFSGSRWTARSGPIRSGFWLGTRCSRIPSTALPSPASTEHFAAR